MNKLTLSPLFIVLLMLTACQDDDLAEGMNSLEGSWQVTKVESFYKIPQADGSLEWSSVSDDGNLGRFEFAKDTVSFQFNRNDTLYQGSERWHLSKTKVNDGFFKVSLYTLQIGDTFTFECEFEDETKNSEKNARYITLRTKPEETNDVVSYQMSLDKE